MTVDTKNFGTIEIDEDKVIHFVNGIIGFPQLQDFALIHDEESGDNSGIRWLQSMQEPAFAMPVVDPLSILTEYNPEVNDELLAPLEGVSPDNMLVLVTITVPKDITGLTVNLRAPIVINYENRKACQVIVEGEKFDVKFPIYDILQAAKKQAKEGESC